MELGSKYFNNELTNQTLIDESIQKKLKIKSIKLEKDNKRAIKQASFINKKTHLQSYIYSIIQKVLSNFLKLNTLKNANITFDFTTTLDIKIKLKNKFDAMNLQMQKEKIEDQILTDLISKKIILDAVQINIFTI